MIFKKCSECKNLLDICNFNKNRRRSDGYHEYCKDCRKAQYLRRDQEGAIKRSAKRYVENKEECLQKMKARYIQIAESKKEYGRNHYKANKFKYISNVQLRKDRLKQATPSWFDEFNEFAFQEAYHLASVREKATGIAWDVDHIVPLCGKKVCGLNVIDNIAVIPRVLNNAKRTKFFEQDDRTLFYSRKSK